jgi:hypothetical protein
MHARRLGNSPRDGRRQQELALIEEGRQRLVELRRVRRTLRVIDRRGNAWIAVLPPGDWHCVDWFVIYVTAPSWLLLWTRTK